MASSDKVLSNEPRRKYTPAVFRSAIVVLMDGRLAGGQLDKQRKTR